MGQDSVETQFEDLHARLKSLEQSYNPERENLHFSMLDRSDADIYGELLSLAQDGLRKVRQNRSFFLKNRLYDDGMFWYELCLLISSAVLTTAGYHQQETVRKDILINLIETLVDIAEYSTTGDGDDMWKRSHEALGNTLLAFDDVNLIRLVQAKAKALGLERVNQFIDHTIATVLRKQKE